MLVYLDII